MALGLPVDMGGDDIICNNLFIGAASPGQLGTSTGVSMALKYKPVIDNQNQLAAASYAVSHTIFVNDNTGSTYKIAAVSAVFGTAGGAAAAVQVEVATGTQAIGAGTNQLTAAIALTGAANTVVNGTLIASPTVITAGARINLIFSGTVTGLANATINVSLQKVS